MDAAHDETRDWYDIETTWLIGAWRRCVLHLLDLAQIANVLDERLEAAGFGGVHLARSLRKELKEILTSLYSLVGSGR